MISGYVLGAEEVGGGQVTVAVGGAGVDAAGGDREVDPASWPGSAVSTWAVPLNSLNWPRTLVTIAWRATKPRRVWAGSMV